MNSLQMTVACCGNDGNTGQPMVLKPNRPLVSHIYDPPVRRRSPKRNTAIKNAATRIPNRMPINLLMVASQLLDSFLSRPADSAISCPYPRRTQGTDGSSTRAERSSPVA